MGIIIGETEIYKIGAYSGQLSSLKRVPVCSGPGIGEVWFIYPDQIELVDGGRVSCRLQAPDDLVAYSPFLSYAILSEAKSVLMVSHHGENIYKLASQEPTLASILPIKRENDNNFTFADFIVSGSYLLFKYEWGIVCFSELGEIRWQHVYDTLEWHFAFDKVENGYAWYASEWDGRWGYSLEDGSRVE